jgi:hypothetical protein
MEPAEISLTLTWVDGLPVGRARWSDAPDESIAFSGWLELADAVRRLVPESG